MSYICTLRVSELQFKDLFNVFSSGLYLNEKKKKLAIQNIKHIKSFKYFYSSEKFTKLLTNTYAVENHFSALLVLSASFAFKNKMKYWSETKNQIISLHLFRHFSSLQPSVLNGITKSDIHESHVGFDTSNLEVSYLFYFIFKKIIFTM